VHFGISVVRNLFPICVLVLFLASCAKDEPLQPRHPLDAPIAGDLDKDGEDTDQPDAEGGTGTISDDGDDLNDGEGRRKKKKP
jgi:hypothetical protein